jgi:hypothetical protein
MALDVVSDYISEVRTLLQDSVEPFRYPDADLVAALNNAMIEGRRMRADLFVYRGHGRTPSFSDNDATEVEMEEPFRVAFVYGATAFALFRDQEDIEDERASSFLNTFNSMLLGPRQSPIGGRPSGQQQARR